MEYQEAVTNLVRLLCVSVSTLSLDEISKLVKKRYLQWHPDKNDGKDIYAENFRLLNESWNRFKQGPLFDSQGSSNLFCSEEFDPSWETSDEDSDYNNTPFDDDFFNASPTKRFAIPEDLKQFFRSKSNRRAGKLFLIFALQRDLKCLEQFAGNALFKSAVIWDIRTNKDILFCVLVSFTEHRLIDLKKIVKKHSILDTEIFYGVNLYKLIDFAAETYKDPIVRKGEKIERSSEKPKAFNNKLIVNFAISHQITDALTLMYEYAHLAEPCDRKFINKDHEDDHLEEIENAKIFVMLSDRKRTAKNACDCVVAKLYSQLNSINNIEWLEIKSRDMANKITDDANMIEKVGEAWYYFKYIIGKENFSSIVKYIMEGFLHNTPKQRYTALMGGYNSGKTTFASALCKLLEGVNINLNINKDRLPFYLGSAIGKRFVLFDDVKGLKYIYPPKMPTGPGLSNLDDLRDHIDGHIEVQLEKKNQNPIEQKFPPGVITMNKYIMPESLKQRIKIVDFKENKLYSYHSFKVTSETMFIAMALDNLIPCDKYALEYFENARMKWSAKHNNCPCLKISKEGSQQHGTQTPHGSAGQTPHGTAGQTEGTPIL